MVNALPCPVIHPAPAHIIERVGLPLVVGVGDLVLSGLDGLGLLAVDFGGLRLEIFQYVHLVLLLVMEGRPWYNGRALVRGCSGASFALVTVASGGRGFYLSAPCVPVAYKSFGLCVL